jgi:hypothetical protein
MNDIILLFNLKMEKQNNMKYWKSYALYPIMPYEICEKINDYIIEYEIKDNKKKFDKVIKQINSDIGRILLKRVYERLKSIDIYGLTFYDDYYADINIQYYSIINHLHNLKYHIHSIIYGYNRIYMSNFLYIHISISFDNVLNKYMEHSIEEIINEEHFDDDFIDIE